MIEYTETNNVIVPVYKIIDLTITENTFSTEDLSLLETLDRRLKALEAIQYLQEKDINDLESFFKEFDDYERIDYLDAHEEFEEFSVMRVLWDLISRYQNSYNSTTNEYFFENTTLRLTNEKSCYDIAFTTLLLVRDKNNLANHHDFLCLDFFNYLPDFDTNRATYLAYVAKLINPLPNLYTRFIKVKGYRISYYDFHPTQIKTAFDQYCGTSENPDTCNYGFAYCAEVSQITPGLYQNISTINLPTNSTIESSSTMPISGYSVFLVIPIGYVYTKYKTIYNCHDVEGPESDSLPMVNYISDGQYDNNYLDDSVVRSKEVYSGLFYPLLTRGNTNCFNIVNKVYYHQQVIGTLTNYDTNSNYNTFFDRHIYKADAPFLIDQYGTTYGTENFSYATGSSILRCYRAFNASKYYGGYGVYTPNPTTGSNGPMYLIEREYKNVRPFSFWPTTEMGDESGTSGNFYFTKTPADFQVFSIVPQVHIYDFPIPYQPTIQSPFYYRLNSEQIAATTRRQKDDELLFTAEHSNFLNSSVTICFLRII